MNSITTLLTVFITVIITIAKAQSIEELDKANGFKTYHLNSPIALHYKNLELGSKESNGVMTYDFKNPDNITFHKISPRAAMFGYYKNNLYDIMMFFDDYNMMSYKRILEELRLMYGLPTEYKETLIGGFWVAWKGKKVQLLTQYFKDNSFAIEFRSVDLERKILIDNN